MKNITFSAAIGLYTFSFLHASYLVEVTKSDAILPIYLTAYLFDNQLRDKYGNLLFTQKNDQSPIEPTLSTTPNEAELKEIILQKIMNKMKVFE